MSRIRANQITNQSADGAPTVQNGLVVSGVTTSTNVSVASSVTATTFYGSGANLTGITQTTINTNADNRIITGSGTANTLNGEANLTYDGTDLTVTGSNTKIIVDSRGSNGDQAHIQLLAKDGSGNNNFGEIEYDGDGDFSISSRGTGSANNDIVFKTTASNTERLRIKSDGKIEVPTTGKLSLGMSSPVAQFTAGTANGSRVIEIQGTDGVIRGFNRNSGAWAQIDFEAASYSFDISGTEKVRIDSGGRLLVNTTSSSISSSELFEVKSTSTGFSHFRNNSSSYAPIYIDNEASNDGATLVPIITVTDGGGNRAGLLLNNNSQFDISGQGSLTFSTGGTVGNATERMKINSNGYVTTPSQPMCSYDLNSSIQSGNYIIHNTVHTNNGNHYNTGNGRFVCPTAGYYYASIMAMTNNSSTQLDIELHKNGSNPNNILVPYNQSGGVYNQVAGSCIIYCAANDYLQFKLNSGSVYNGRHGNVSFALLA